MVGTVLGVFHGLGLYKKMFDKLFLLYVLGHPESIAEMGGWIWVLLIATLSLTTFMYS